jgi:hypothetical protein
MFTLCVKDSFAAAHGLIGTKEGAKIFTDTISLLRLSFQGKNSAMTAC